MSLNWIEHGGDLVAQGNHKYVIYSNGGGSYTEGRGLILQCDGQNIGKGSLSILKAMAEDRERSGKSLGVKCSKCGCDIPNQGQKGMKPASEVRVGDTIQTGDGRWRQVTEVGQHQNDVQITVGGSRFKEVFKPDAPVQVKTMNKGMTRAEDLQPGSIIKLPTRQWARLVEVRGDLAGKLGKVPVKVENAPGHEELSRFDHWFRPGEMVETK